MDQSPPRRTIGKYEILAPLGRGAMGIVYQAKDPEIGRIVAVKTLRAPLAGQGLDADKAFERFRNEARSAGNLRHPNIITIFDVGRDGVTPFLVMDHVIGRGLDELILAQNRLSPEYTLHILGQIALGLDYAHRQGVIHRDIKPSNIIVDMADHAYILDFGIARLPEELVSADHGAKPGTIIGTPGYMAPEHILNEPLDPRADLFSFAVVAFECFTGHRPFPGSTVNEILGAILNGKPTPLTSIAPDLPLSLEAELERALSRNRALRLGSGQELVRAIAAALKLPDPIAAPTSAGIGAAPVVKPVSSWDTVADAERLPRSPESARAPQQKITVPQRAVARVRGPQHGARQRRLGWLLGAALCAAALVVCFFREISFRVSGSSAPAAPVVVPAQAQFGLAEPFAALIVPQTEKPKLDQPVKDWTAAQLRGALIDITVPEPLVLEVLVKAAADQIPQFADAAVKQLESDSYLVRLATIKSLTLLGDIRVIPALVPLLKDYDPLVRGHVARSLGFLKDRRAIAALNQRLGEEQAPEVRTAIENALTYLLESGDPGR